MLDSRSDPFIGKTLGTFTLQRVIGRGGMGMVYLAQQSRPRRTVAMKVLTPDIFPNQTAFSEFLVRFRREADAIAALEHINIMPIYEYGEQDEFAYLVMPYIPGGTLRDVVAKRKSLPIAEVIPITEQIASALDYAHKNGIVHRDLKLGNILFHTDGRLLLADFGIAKVLNESDGGHAPALQTLTSTGMIIGTPEYLSPEQAIGGAIDHRSDIYSLGVVLFQLLSGQVPFSGTTPVATAVKHAMDEPPSLSMLNPTIPLSVERVIMKALAKKPEQRFASAGEMARALRAAASEAMGGSPLTLTGHTAAVNPEATSAVMNAEATSAVVNTEAPPMVLTSETASLGKGEAQVVLANEATVMDSVTPVRAQAEAREKQHTDPTMAIGPRVADERTVEVKPSRPAIAPGRQRRPARVVWISALLVVLIAAGSVVYLRTLAPGASTTGGPNTRITPTTAAKAGTPTTATTAPAQTALPHAAIPVGKLLYGATIPGCYAQADGWTLDSSMQAACKESDMQLTNSNSGQPGFASLKSLPGGGGIPNDYVLEFQVKPGSGAFGVFFRVQSGAGHHGGYGFQIEPSGAWQGFYVDDANGQRNTLYNGQGDLSNANSFTTIDVVVQGGDFHLYYNGKVQGGISDPNYTSGSLAIALAGGASASFKNFGMYALPA